MTESESCRQRSFRMPAAKDLVRDSGWIQEG